MSTAISVALDGESGAPKSYRVDIDGLRAIAVLSVILHHFLVPGFGGGFVGVDVFFVISGFLIAGHIDRDIRANRFSLLGFYERRIRRIFPAFFVMYGLAMLAVWIILIPRDLRPAVNMALRVIPFLANIVFYRNVGTYGGEFASRIPLLHTWSLAVEEQFYLFFPLLMLALSRYFKHRRVEILALLAVVSFVSCAVVVRAIPSAAFYLTPYRAWELFAGALLAVAKPAPPDNTRVRTVVAALGLLLIVAADFWFSYAIPYPSELTLLPCAGAVAVIYSSAGPTTLTGKVLGNPVMRRIGWWSYSLYLFHWPLLVLAGYYLFDPLSIPMRCVLLAVTFLLGWLSWRFVEQPFRRPNALLTRPVVYGLAAAVGGLLMAGTLVLRHASDPRLYNAQQRALFAGETSVQTRCRNTAPSNTERPACKLGDAAAPAETVLWGDSHAVALLPAFDAAYAKHHEALMFAQHGGCPALLRVSINISFPDESDLLLSWLDALGATRSARCYRDTETLLNWIIQHRIRTVILAGHWTAYSEGRLGVRLTDSQSPHNHSLVDNADVFSRGMERLLSSLSRSGVRVFVVNDVPENPLDVPYALVSARRLGLSRDFRITRAQYEVQQHSATEIFTRLQARYGFQFLKPQDYLCADGRCAIARDGIPLYVDGEHLAPPGAEIAAPALEAIWDNEETLPRSGAARAHTVQR